MSERRVLVVEDEPAISDAVAARLRAEGFDVAAAAGRSVRLAMSDCGGDASWSHSGPAMVQRSTR